MYIELTKAIPNFISCTDTPMAYKTLQHIITEDGVWKIPENLLRHWAPHPGDKEEDLQKNIYDMQVIYTEELS